jgi:Histone acetyltransferase
VHLRVSTRPDRIDPSTLARLRGSGVSMVELGVQTFNSRVLERSGRGYDAALAARACDMVREAGLELGIQLLPGLPGHEPGHWREDVRRTLALAPDVVRIYPCVVMGGTGLADMHARGEYEPWPLETAVTESGWALLRFWEAGCGSSALALRESRGCSPGWSPAHGIRPSGTWPALWPCCIFWRSGCGARKAG